MNMKRLIYTTMVISIALTAFANDYVKDAEPAILEVHYDRTEYHDSTDHDKGHFKDPVMLRIGKDKSVFCGVKRLWQDSIMRCDPATFWAMDRARIMSEKELLSSCRADIIGLTFIRISRKRKLPNGAISIWNSGSIPRIGKSPYGK